MAEVTRGDGSVKGDAYILSRFGNRPLQNGDLLTEFMTITGTGSADTFTASTQCKYIKTIKEINVLNNSVSAAEPIVVIAAGGATATIDAAASDIIRIEVIGWP